MLNAWRKPLKKTGNTPFEKELDGILVSDDLDAVAVLHSAAEDFAQELAALFAGF